MLPVCGLGSYFDNKEFVLFCSNEEEMGLDYLMRKYILSPLNRINKFFEDCHSHLFSNSQTFQVLSKFP